MIPIRPLLMGTTRWTLGLALAVAAAVPGAGSISARQSSPAAGDAAFTQALQKGEVALKARQFEPALDAFKQANALKNKSSAVALFGVARAYHGLKAYKSEADACGEALKYAGEDTRLAAQLHHQRGQAFVLLAERPTDKALKDAEAEFTAVLKLTDTMPMAAYNLGVVLMKQNRDQEGAAALKAYIDTGARTPEVDLAKMMIVEPRRAREAFAPEFGAASIDGEYVTLKELQGKVVLLDFWGTWCPPCVAATPALVEISREFAKAPFTIVGISSDKPADAGVLKDFVAQHKMTWPEIHDTARKIIPLYDVTTYPTYVVIDAEGIIRDRVQGLSDGTKGELQTSIRKWLKAIPKAPAPLGVLNPRVPRER
jgi:peroxiredoxin